MENIKTPGQRWAKLVSAGWQRRGLQLDSGSGAAAGQWFGVRSVLMLPRPACVKTPSLVRAHTATSPLTLERLFASSMI